MMLPADVEPRIREQEPQPKERKSEKCRPECDASGDAEAHASPFRVLSAWPTVRRFPTDEDCWRVPWGRAAGYMPEYSRWRHLLRPSTDGWGAASARILGASVGTSALV